jgi:trehalose-6-phosphate synthase
MKYLKHTFKDIIKPLDSNPQISVYEEKILNKSPEFNREISFLSTETYTPTDSIQNMKNISQKFSESVQSINTEGTDLRIEKLQKQRAKEKYDAEIAVVRLSYVHCVEMILHIAEHAAGIFRVAQRVTNTGELNLWVDVCIYAYMDIHLYT